MERIEGNGTADGKERVPAMETGGENAVGKGRRATQRGLWAEDAGGREYQRHYPLIKYITQNLSRPVN